MRAAHATRMARTTRTFPADASPARRVTTLSNRRRENSAGPAAPAAPAPWPHRAVPWPCCWGTSPTQPGNRAIADFCPTTYETNSLSWEVKGWASSHAACCTLWRVRGRKPGGRGRGWLTQVGGGGARARARVRVRGFGFMKSISEASSEALSLDHKAATSHLQRACSSLVDALK